MLFDVCPDLHSDSEGDPVDALNDNMSQQELATLEPRDQQCMGAYIPLKQWVHPANDPREPLNVLFDNLGSKIIKNICERRKSAPFERTTPYDNDEINGLFLFLEKAKKLVDEQDNKERSVRRKLPSSVFCAEASQRNRWSEKEVDMLIEGVNRFGEGRWTEILGVETHTTDKIVQYSIALNVSILGMSTPQGRGFVEGKMAEFA